MFCHLVPVAYVKTSASSAIPNSLAAYWPFVSDTSIKLERSNHCFLILSPTCDQAVDFSFMTRPTSPFHSPCHCYPSQALLILLLDQRPSLSETAALFFHFPMKKPSVVPKRSPYEVQTPRLYIHGSFQLFQLLSS